MPLPGRTTVVSFFTFVAVLCLAFLFRPQNVPFLQSKPVSQFEEGYYGDVIGIDLGRTYSRVGIFRNNTFEIIADERGRTAVPSYVAFTKQAPLVGFEAMERAASDPKNTIFDVRLLLGRKFSDPEVQDIIQTLPYDVVQMKQSMGDPFIRVIIKGLEKLFYPEEISAKVIEKLKYMAEEHLDRRVYHAVITVPSHFNDTQGQATKDAATIAGLNLLRIVNEPTAAGIAYGIETDYYAEEQNYIFYNLGAKESHLAFESVEGGIYEVLAHTADRNIGGENFENTQTQAGELNSNLSGRILDLIKQLLVKAEMDKSKVDCIIFNRNASHIAKVQPLVETYLDGKKALFREDIKPDEAVVRGAAIQGNVLSSLDDEADMYWPLTLNPLSLGIETAGGIFTKLIPRNTALPTRKTGHFSTTADDQEKVVIKVMEGERAVASKNRVLGTLKLEGLLPRSRGFPDIEVVFELDYKGSLTVVAKEKDGGKEAKFVLGDDEEQYNMEEIDEILMDAEKHYEEDEELFKEHLKKVQAGNEEDAFGIVAK